MSARLGPKVSRARTHSGVWVMRSGLPSIPLPRVGIVGGSRAEESGSSSERSSRHPPHPGVPIRAPFPPSPPLNPLGSCAQASEAFLRREVREALLLGGQRVVVSLTFPADSRRAGLVIPASAHSHLRSRHLR